MLNKFIKKELLYGANNYKPLNVIIKQGKCIHLTDINN